MPTSGPRSLKAGSCCWYPGSASPGPGGGGCDPGPGLRGASVSVSWSGPAPAAASSSNCSEGLGDLNTGKCLEIRWHLATVSGKLDKLLLSTTMFEERYKVFKIREHGLPPCLLSSRHPRHSGDLDRERGWWLEEERQGKVYIWILIHISTTSHYLYVLSE